MEPASQASSKAIRQLTDDQEDPVYDTPDHKVQSLTMPEAADQKNHHDVAVLPHSSLSGASQRKVDVLDKPIIQADMPAVPELFEVDGKEGIVKVPFHGKTEHCSGPDGHVGIAGKVRIELDGEQHRRSKMIEAVVVARSIKDIGNCPGEAVRHAGLDKHAPDEQEKAVNQLLLIRILRRCKLRKKVSRLLDRSGEDGGEKGDKGKESKKAVLSRDPVPVDIPQIESGLKDVKGKPHREGDAAVVEDLISDQDSNRQGKEQGKEAPLLLRAFRPLDQQSSEVDDSGRKKKEHHSERAPPAVEDAACSCHHQVLMIGVFHQSVCHQDKEKKHCKCQGNQVHIHTDCTLEEVFRRGSCLSAIGFQNRNILPQLCTKKGLRCAARIEVRRFFF